MLNDDELNGGSDELEDDSFFDDDDDDGDDGDDDDDDDADDTDDVEGTPA